MDRLALSILCDPYTQARKGVTRIHATRRTGARASGRTLPQAENGNLPIKKRTITMTYDLYSSISAVQAIVPAVKAAADGTAIDPKDSTAVAFIVNTGAIVGVGDFGVKVLQDRPTWSSSGYVTVAAEFVDTNAPATLAADTTYKLGYRGNKRYVRLQLTKAGGTSIAAGAVAVLDPLDKPVA